ncbi:aminotransferase class III-fold pyridoxal phosphate-dependent enzyme [Paenarthrobacter sp. NPDC089675]|uniref:aminotransferase class III-fold pyridoxal phosphate-dependent enzyme n=1 Tax=Paenarthrobacter sp. NPDC089675 TaxID=3364376 RepID=UPI0037F5BD5F
MTTTSPQHVLETSELSPALVEEYTATRPRSREAFEKARRLLPGGQTRSVTHYEPFPSLIRLGRGQMLVDLDGHEYFDALNNYTSLVHGNAFGPASDAVRALLDQGVAFASVHSEQTDLARRILDRLSSADLVRFTNSGSEASSLAARIARHVTGRREIVMAEGGFHGSVAPLLPGEPNVVLVPYNDLQALEQAVTERTAAVFLEPFQGAGGVIPGKKEYLQHAQKVANSQGALFVLDEIQSLRNNYHGVQENLGLSPDLTLIGKIIGGGFPIGAVAGRAKLLDATSPYTVGGLQHAGTFNGHLAAAAAGSATLDYLDSAAISRLNAGASELASAIEDGAAAAGIKVVVTRDGSIMNIHPHRVPENAKEAAKPYKFHRSLHLALMLEGVYAATRGMLNLSTALTDSDLREVGKLYGNAFQRIAQSPDILEDLK